MPLLLALWIALVQALTLASPIRLSAVEAGAFVAAAGDTSAGRATAGDDAGRAVRWTGTRAESRVRTEAPRSADETLHLALPVRSLSPARSTTPALAGPPAAALVAAPHLPDAAQGAAEVRARTLARSHVESARGGVRPYFATAPPLRG